MDDLEALAIKAARGNNGGTWADHYTEDHKKFWRQFVRELAAAEREACAKLVESGNVADTRSRNLIDHLARRIRDRSNYV